MRKEPLIWVIVSACLPAGGGVSARAGDLLIEYRSELGTIPLTQGWQYDSRCLKENCPVPALPFPAECWWQGSQDTNGDLQPDNNCGFGIGCRTLDGTAHYNSPRAQNIATGCSYTEWVTFDDGNNAAGRLILPDSTLPDSPPWGAPGFLRSPPGHFAIRVSTGDGNLTADSLATLPPLNNRNQGKVAIRRAYTWSGLDNAVTVIAKIAAGPFLKDHDFLQVRTPTYQFSFTVNGAAGNPNLGRIGYTDLFGLIDYLFPGRKVAVTLPGTLGPHVGEFFIFRVVCRDDGTFTAWLNDDPASSSSSSVMEVPGSAPQVVFGTIATDDECIWVDYIKVLDGEVPPPLCPDPVFDINRDGLVDTRDLTNDPDGLLRCQTGPAPSSTVFAALSPECRCLDVNGDESIDSRDFAAFQRCLTLGNAPIDPACDDR